MGWWDSWHPWTAGRTPLPRRAWAAGAGVRRSPPPPPRSWAVAGAVEGQGWRIWTLGWSVRTGGGWVRSEFGFAVGSNLLRDY